jgi:hypothetical protein
VLSKEYIRKKWPMRELRILVERWQAGSVRLVPVLYHLQMEDLADIRSQYDSDWFVAESKPPPDALDKYAEDLKKLSTCTMIRPDQVRPFARCPPPEVWNDQHWAVLSWWE